MFETTYLIVAPASDRPSPDTHRPEGVTSLTLAVRRYDVPMQLWVFQTVPGRSSFAEACAVDRAMWAEGILSAVASSADTVASIAEAFRA